MIMHIRIFGRVDVFSCTCRDSHMFKDKNLKVMFGFTITSSITSIFRALWQVIIKSFEDFSVLANGTNDFRIKLQESLLIHRDGPQLNKTSESAPLMLFS